ncbi:sensor histidine kinase [Leptodesmis sp.]|uniref:sensor histidine kinase n=1 Tax=Leptodesmis sp. TaxID=3100501 RepID=UPI0040535B7B
MFQATRRRLALWYTTITAILLLFFASGVYLYVRSTLIERVDDTLNHVVEVVRRSLVIEPVDPHSEGGLLRVNIEASFRGNQATTEDDRIDIEWFSPSGELIWSTLGQPLDVPLHPNSNGETARVSSSPLVLRQITQRIEVGRSVLGYLRVSHPWFEVTKPSREFFVDLALGIGAMVVAVGAIGWFLSGLAMEPVRESYQRLKQFTADASHELRSPIAVIQTNVQVALADPNPDPQSLLQHLRVVERLTRRLGRLVDDLLFLARQDSGIVQSRWQAIALDKLLQEVIEEQQTLSAEKGIWITLTLLSPNSIPTASLSAFLDTEPDRGGAIALVPSQPPSDPWTLTADRDQLVRLFTNLVDNAVQYTPAQGRVNLELQRVGRVGSYALQVKVKDTGVGIPPEAIPHLFDRFYRVDPARSQTSNTGSGLGLAIAQAIVQNHQGQIQVESELNQGTTVTVTLPQREESG